MPREPGDEPMMTYLITDSSSSRHLLSLAIVALSTNSLPMTSYLGTECSSSNRIDSLDFRVLVFAITQGVARRIEPHCIFQPLAISN